MKVISVIYMSRRNFWCVTRGDSWHLNFQLQKVDWEPSGRQNWGKMMEFWKILYIHFIRDPKGITYVRLILKIESDAKMAGPNRTWGVVVVMVMVVVAFLIIVSSQNLFFDILTLNQSIWGLEKFAGGGLVSSLFDYNVTSGPDQYLKISNTDIIILV